MSYHEEIDMTPQEIHGTQLRMATESLENGVEMFELRLESAIDEATVMLGELTLKNATTPE